MSTSDGVSVGVVLGLGISVALRRPGGLVTPAHTHTGV